MLATAVSLRFYRYTHTRARAHAHRYTQPRTPRFLLRLSCSLKLSPQALDDEPVEPAALVRTPSAALRYEVDEVARLEETGTQAEIARVKAEVARLKRELGLE